MKHFIMFLFLVLWVSGFGQSIVIQQPYYEAGLCKGALISICWSSAADVPADVSSGALDGGTIEGAGSVSPASYDGDKCFTHIVPDYDAQNTSEGPWCARPSFIVRDTLCLISADGSLELCWLCDPRFGCSPILPVELLEFTASVSDAGVLCEWSTASEKDSDYFVLEKSLDMERWRMVGWVSAAGNSLEVQKYSYLESYLPKSVTYYRLRQIDLDGTVNTLPTVTVSSLITGPLVVIPNPVGDVFELSVPVDGLVSVYSVTGKKVMEGEGVDFDVSGLAPGIYFVKTEMGSARFIKN